MPTPRVLLVGDPRFGPTGWWVFEDPRKILQANVLEEVPDVLAQVDRASRSDSLWAVGFVAYEASPAFESRIAVQSGKPGVPLAWFALFEAPRPVAAPLLGQDFSPPAVTPDVSPVEHAQAIDAIHEAIGRGDCYQANYTYRLRGEFRGDPAALFAHLVRGQSSAYSLFLEHSDWVVASVSPELFFERLGRTVTCRPMKGTTRRGRTLAEDAVLGQELVASAKERAENVMIVDMVRNDLGRIARVGSVRVPHLFFVERFATVTQMTSDVTAISDATLPELFRALFPCASITGAPKLRTMQILTKLESSPRGIYTGALGFVAPGGNARFSVAIRTAWLDRRTNELEYGTGSGIVWDSQTTAELAESRIKASILDRSEPDFELLETLRWQAGFGFVLLHRHLERMAESAGYFLWPFDRQAALNALEAAVRDLPTSTFRVRLVLNREGCFDATYRRLEDGARRWRVGLAPKPVNAEDRFLFHKTTRRQVYEDALLAVSGVDEVLLWNSDGELTEGTRANLAIRMDGELWTPPVHCGLLGGCLRAEALARGRLRERVLQRKDLQRAERIYLFNSVRGWIPAHMTE